MGIILVKIFKYKTYFSNYKVLLNEYTLLRKSLKYKNYFTIIIVQLLEYKHNV